jgi:hypothetical protein
MRMLENAAETPKGPMAHGVGKAGAEAKETGDAAVHVPDAPKGN